MTVLTVEQLRQQAEATKEYLKERLYVHDYFYTVYDGYLPEDTMVTVSGETVSAWEYCKKYYKCALVMLETDRVKVDEVTVCQEDKIDLPKIGIVRATYNFKTDDFSFSVWDCNYSHYNPILKNTTLESLESDFTKALKELSISQLSDV